MTKTLTAKLGDVAGKTLKEVEMEKLLWLESWSDKPWIRDMARDARIERKLELDGVI
jgi:hypothetical protein